MGAVKAMIVLASIYGPHDSGGKIASTGKRIDHTAMTCAHKTLAIGTKLYLSHGANHIEGEITDRGPYVQGRQLDCTPAVDKALHLGGLGRVRMDFWPPLPRERPQ